jgi:hypothetical protein
MKMIHFPKHTRLKPRQFSNADAAALKLYRLEIGKQWANLISFENELRGNGWTLDEIDHARSQGRNLAQCEIK